MNLAQNLAGDFASSPAGVISGVGIPILAAVLGYFYRNLQNQIKTLMDRVDTRVTAIESETHTQSNALSILVDRIPRDMSRVDKLEDRLNTLNTSHEVLAKAVDRHLSWSATETDKIDAKLDRLSP